MHNNNKFIKALSEHCYKTGSFVTSHAKFEHLRMIMVHVVHAYTDLIYMYIII